VPTKSADPVLQVSLLDLMEVQVGYGLINLVDGEQGGVLLERIKGLRRQTASDMGFLVPPIHIRDNLQLRPNEYAILLKGVELVRGEVMPGHVLAIDPGTAQKGVVHGIPTKEPAFGLPALWVPEAGREQAQMAGYTVVDPSSAIATHLSEIIKRHAHELIGRQEVQSLLDEVIKAHPKLVEELIPNLLPLGTVVRILSNLLRERVPVRDLRTILEVLADHAATTKDPDSLTEVARQALGRATTRQYLHPDGTLPVINLDPRLDRKLAEQVAATAQGGYWSLDPGIAQKLLAGLKQAAERVAAKGQQPIVLCSPTLRRHLRKLSERVLSSVPVLAFSEVDGIAKIKALETVRLGEEAA
jgi:flagellar biosynthesis protein FlhA